MKTKIAAIALALTLGLSTAAAHNGVEHVMGTVTAVAADSITVETTAHKSVVVMIDAATKYTNNGAAAALKDVKTGQRVVIDAKETADKKLQGVTVKMGASSAAHTDHK
jgi:Domain of unknown function (DUF5666)